MKVTENKEKNTDGIWLKKIGNARSVITIWRSFQSQGVIFLYLLLFLFFWWVTTLSKILLRPQVEQMLEKYEWISNERQFFGQPNTAYDFAANDMKEVSRRLSKLQETKEKLGKNVNMRAMNMLGKAEEKVRQSKKAVDSRRGWRYCVVVKWDLAAKPSRAALAGRNRNAASQRTMIFRMPPTFITST